MDVSDDSLVSFYGEIKRGDLNDDGDEVDEVNGVAETEFTNLKAHLKLDEDVGAGGTGLDGEEDNEVAPWLSIQQSIPDDADNRPDVHRLPHQRIRDAGRRT